ARAAAARDRCFNGAASRRRRRGWTPGATRWTRAPLQWGRLPKEAERPRSERCSRTTRAASMGPPPEGGGERYRPRHAPHQQDASMGPPPEGGGEECPCPHSSLYDPELQWGRLPKEAESSRPLRRSM